MADSMEEKTYLVQQKFKKMFVQKAVEKAVSKKEREWYKRKEENTSSSKRVQQLRDIIEKTIEKGNKDAD